MDTTLAYDVAFFDMACHTCTFNTGGNVYSLHALGALAQMQLQHQMQRTNANAAKPGTGMMAGGDGSVARFNTQFARPVITEEAE